MSLNKQEQLICSLRPCLQRGEIHIQPLVASDTLHWCLWLNILLPDDWSIGHCSVFAA
jgi:hypothetical protein